MTSAFADHKRNQTLFDLAQFICIHGADLTYTEADISLCNKLLVILIEDFLRRFVFQIASCLKHFSCKFFNGNVCNKCKCTCSHFVLQCTGRRTEHQCIRNDRSAEKSGDFRRNLQFLFSIHLIHDRACTANRLIAETDRLHCLQCTQFMMINDLHDISLINIIYSLVFFIMIYQNHFFPVHVQKITSGNRTNTFAFFVDDRECTMTMFDHYFLNIICKIFCVKCNQIICFHDIFNRNTLIDQT